MQLEYNTKFEITDSDKAIAVDLTLADHHLADVVVDSMAVLHYY